MPSYQAEVVWERHVKLFGGEVDPNNLGSPCHFTYPHVASVAWPNTWDTDWCGEWRGKPDA